MSCNAIWVILCGESLFAFKLEFLYLYKFNLLIFIYFMFFQEYIRYKSLKTDAKHLLHHR